MCKKTKKILSLLLAGALMGGVFMLGGCNNDNDNTPPPPEYVPIPIGNVGMAIGEVEMHEGDKVATMTVSGFGNMTFRLFPEVAPVAVQNFIDLVEEGFFEGKSIHRVMPNFMIQGGSPFGDGMADPERPTFDVETDLANARHFFGALSMANAGGQNQTQFFVVNNDSPANPRDAFRGSEDHPAYVSLTDEIVEKYARYGGTPFLDGGFTVFGQLIDGFDTLAAITDVEIIPRGNGSNEISLPVEDIIIHSVRVDVY